jgi:hypothetical protein
MHIKLTTFTLCLLALCNQSVVFGQSEQQLANWLKRFPKADANGDGRLTIEEAKAFRSKAQKQARGDSANGAPRSQPPPTFKVDPGWEAARFPDHAICYLSPREIAAKFAKIQGTTKNAVASFDKPDDGSLRIVATGHSFMAPGFGTFPRIANAAGFEQQALFTHTGGGVTGSARYKWEQENGIFQFDGKPRPKLLSSISNAKWDAMMWGPFYNDRAEYYSCWIDFCLKYNPDMKFYLSDAWPQIDQFKTYPTSQDELTSEAFVRLGQEKYATYEKIISELNKKYPGKVYILPTCEAMVLAVQYYHRGELPGVEGIHKLVGKKERSLWRDRIGHLGPGFANLEGYVFYATIYGRSPELIKEKIRLSGNADYPNADLDRTFRKIAWQAVLNNPLSGIKDENKDGIRDTE